MFNTQEDGFLLKHQMNGILSSGVSRILDLKRSKSGKKIAEKPIDFQNIHQTTYVKSIVTGGYNFLHTYTIGSTYFS